MKKAKLLVVCILVAFGSKSAKSQSVKSDVLSGFPVGYTPQEVGSLVAERFIPSGHLLHGGKWIHYAEVCAWYGALKFAEASNDRDLIERLRQRFDLLFTSEKDLQPIMNHVDLNMFGCLPLEFYQVTGQQKYLELGLPYADTQWQLPGNANAEEKAWAEKGHSWQTRLWIDDMFMITIVQSQAYKATGNREYIDRAAREMVLYLDELQRPNGLFYHAPDAPYYWARGNGWMAAGMTELLRYLPEDNPDRPRILDGYRLMMNSLLRYQADSGIWNQLIDEPDFWPETSGSAMFTFAIINGVKNGWLEEPEYVDVARRGWLALIPYITPEGDVTQVCIGTNKSPDRRHYYDRPRQTGDFHGQAPVLWCAYSLLEE